MYMNFTLKSDDGYLSYDCLSETDATCALIKFKTREL